MQELLNNTYILMSSPVFVNVTPYCTRTSLYTGLLLPS